MRIVVINLFFCGLFCFLMACTTASNDNTSKHNESEKVAMEDQSERNIEHLTAKKLCSSDSPNIAWIGGGVYSIWFEEHRLYYAYSQSCIYWYPTEYKNDSIIMYWDFNEDCVFDRGLHNTFGLREFPQKKKPFASFSVLNDSILDVKYYYPEWVALINKSEQKGQELFPVRLMRTPFH